MFKIIALCALLTILCSIVLIICTDCANRDTRDTFMSTALVVCVLNIWLSIITMIYSIRGILLNGDILMSISEKSSCITVTKENNELTDICITYNGEEHHFKISDNSDVKHHFDETNR